MSPLCRTLPRLFFQQDDGTPQGGGSSRRPRRLSLDDVTAQFGDDLDALRRAYRDAQADAVQFRWDRNQARERVAELERQVPPEGAVVLTAAEAAQWQQYRALGEAPAVALRLHDAEGAASELASLRRERQIGEVAQASGYNARVLARLAGDQSFELRDEQHEGQAVRRAYIRDGETLVPLADYATRTWGEFMPALAPATEPPGTPPAPPRVPYPPQPPAASGTSGDLVAEYLAARTPRA
jgi:hypothetical protein